MDLDSPGFPGRRPRRARSGPAMRRLVAETRVSVDDLILPLFVREDIGEARPIDSLPGVYQHTLDTFRAEVHRAAAAGIPGVLLFGIPASKDAIGSGAWDPDGIVQRALTVAREEVGGDVVVMADLCLDEYTDHGHCGVLDARGDVDNDATLGLYRRVARAQAQAGADVVAPSGMMDGQVAAIRGALDSDGATGVAIMAYSAKYASAFYGPFRDAVDVTIADGGDRRTYQQDPANARESAQEIALDVAEGADIVMVKPATVSLDVIARARTAVDLPIAAYHVSGEYAALCAAAERGWLDLDAAALEQLTVIRRAGADMICTYFALRAAELLAELH